MKTRFVFYVITTLLLFSCTGFFDMAEEIVIKPIGDNSKSPTNVIFDNLDNALAVDIFYTHTRTTNARGDNAKPLDKDDITDKIPWFATKTNEEYIFYLTYYLPILDQDIPVRTYKYIPVNAGIPFSFNYISKAIPFEKNTTVKIHDLKNDVNVPNDVFLVNESYIFIRNNNSASVVLTVGTLLSYPTDSQNPSISTGQTGLFKLNPVSSTANINIRIGGVGGTAKEIGVSKLEKGYIYYLEVETNGNVKKTQEMELMLKNF